jgi:N-acyl homoserine lactone hydrolase
MKIEMFNVGWISSSAAVWREGEDPEREIRFPVPAYLIETDTERILIDTGLNPNATSDPAGFYGRPEAGLFGLELEQGIGEQIDASTLTRIVLTHLHFDHVGGLALLPGSIPIVIQRREWEAGRDEQSIRRNFLYPRDYALDGREVVLVDGNADLLGDGFAVFVANNYVQHYLFGSALDNRLGLIRCGRGLSKECERGQSGSG